MNNERFGSNGQTPEINSGELVEGIVKDMEERAAADGITLVELLKRALATQNPQE